MDGVTSTDDARIARRYPKRTLWDWLLYGGLALGIGVAFVITVMAALDHANPPVASMVRSFTVDTPTSARVELVVQRQDPTLEAECTLVAKAESYEEVGETTVRIPADTEEIKAYSFTVQTVKEPVAVEQDGCRIVSG